MNLNDLALMTRAKAVDTMSGLRWSGTCPVCHSPAMHIIQDPAGGWTMECLYSNCTETQILNTLNVKHEDVIASDPKIEEKTQQILLNLQAKDDAQERHARLKAAQSVDQIELVTARELLSEDIADATYLVDRLWPAGGNVLLAAQAKAGKSTLSLNLTKAIATGTRFLGQFETAQPAGNIGIVDLELNRGQLQQWMRGVGVDQDNVVIFPMRGRASAIAGSILDPQARRAFAAQLRDANISVLIIDPLSVLLNSIGIDENSNTEVGRFLRAGLAELREEAGITEMLVIHHAGHSAQRGRGASVIMDWPDALWTLTVDNGSEDLDDTGDEDTATRFLTARGRDVHMPETALTFHEDTKTLTVEQVGLSKRKLAYWKSQSRAAQAIMGALHDAGGSIEGKRELQQAASLSGASMKAPLERLIESGWVTEGQVIRGRKTTYSLTDEGAALAAEADADPGEIQRAEATRPLQ